MFDLYLHSLEYYKHTLLLCHTNSLYLYLIYHTMFGVQIYLDTLGDTPIRLNDTIWD